MISVVATMIWAIMQLMICARWSCFEPRQTLSLGGKSLCCPFYFCLDAQNLSIELGWQLHVVHIASICPSSLGLHADDEGQHEFDCASFLMLAAAFPGFL